MFDHHLYCVYFLEIEKVHNDVYCYSIVISYTMYINEYLRSILLRTCVARIAAGQLPTSTHFVLKQINNFAAIRCGWTDRLTDCQATLVYFQYAFIYRKQQLPVERVFMNPVAIYKEDLPVR